MKVKAFWVLAITLGVLVSLVWGATEQWLKTSDITTREKNSLKGISSVSILVEPLDTAAKACGLRRDSIQSEIESQLKEYGIRDYGEKKGEEERWTAEERLRLCIKFQLIQAYSSSAILVTVKLKEDVITMTRKDNSFVDGATTWEVERFVLSKGGFLYKSELKGMCEQLKDYCINEFINDYLAANPKTKE